jgi:hypothetical protein
MWNFRITSRDQNKNRRRGDRSQERGYRVERDLRGVRWLPRIVAHHLTRGKRLDAASALPTTPGTNTRSHAPAWERVTSREGKGRTRHIDMAKPWLAIDLIVNSGECSF